MPQLLVIDVPNKNRVNYLVRPNLIAAADEFIPTKYRTLVLR